jgi:hypothetical protein
MLRFVHLVRVSFFFNHITFVGCDDVVPLLHVVVENRHDVNAGLRVSFAAADAAASRAEQLLLLGVEEMRRMRNGKNRAEISGNDLFSVAAKRFIKALAPAKSDVKRSDREQFSNDPAAEKPEKGNITNMLFTDFPSVVAAVLDLILFAITYYIKPEWHCQPLLVLYWWTIGVLVLVHDQQLTFADALEVLVEMATTVGYGSNPPRSSGLMFWHSMHAMTALTTGLNEAMDSLADYVINNLDRFIGPELFKADNQHADDGCISDEETRDEANVQQIRSLITEDTSQDISVWVTEEDFWQQVEKDDEKAVEPEETPSHKRAVIICSQAVLSKRLMYRALSCLLFVAVTTLYLTMDFEVVNTTRTENGPDGDSVKGNELSMPVRMGNALYTAVITMSTVGYGDISPASQGMRLIAPLILNGLTHDFARFVEIVAQMKDSDDEATKLTKLGLNFAAGMEAGHSAASHDLGIHNCPLLSAGFVEEGKKTVEHQRKNEAENDATEPKVIKQKAVIMPVVGHSLFPKAVVEKPEVMGIGNDKKIKIVDGQETEIK